jgi:hypothetical protein
VSEFFIHYLWQFQYFNKIDLVTADGDPIQVFHPGSRNTHSGPDFFQARLQIGTMEWVGSIEIHVDASSWVDHHHNTDAAYDNVVLHVVWKNDKPVFRNDGTLLPVLELKDRVDEKLILNFKKLVNSPEQIPCSTAWLKVSPLTKLSALDRALAQRLEVKAILVTELYKRNNGDWEETTYQLLCKNFGFKVNAEPFEQLGRSLPFKIILKHRDKLHQIEALLFGNAGFLEKENGDEYYNLLRQEYKLLSSKYGLIERKLAKAQWRFLRLRPANFPTIRIAQLAAVLYYRYHIFSMITAAESTKDMRSLFSIEQSPYWLNHYGFSKTANDDIPFLGEKSIENIVINTVVPILAAYSKMKDEQLFMDRAIAMLQEISSEQNAIVKLWHEVGMRSNSAFDSQAMIELYSSFCQKRRCLECTIGYAVLKPAKV